MGRLLTVLVSATLASSAYAIHPLVAFKTVLPTVKKETKVAILLPATLPTAGKSPKLYATGAGTSKSWALVLAGAKNCGGADACFIASFQGQRSGKLPAGIKHVRLSNGDAAAYQPITCGASCAPASFWFVHKGVLYAWQLKDAPKNALASFERAAASAIAAGAR